jgi:hypothetical protein
MPGGGPSSSSLLCRSHLFSLPGYCSSLSLCKTRSLRPFRSPSSAALQNPPVIAKHPFRKHFDVPLVQAFQNPHDDFRIPPEARILPPKIVQSTSDLYLRRLWGNPEEDLAGPQPRNLLVITAGIQQKENVDSMIEKARHHHIVVDSLKGLVLFWGSKRGIIGRG